MPDFIHMKQVIQDTATAFPNKEAYFTIQSEKSCTSKDYQTLYSEMNALGTALYSLGLKGKHIAVVGENRYEWALSCLTVICGVGVSVNLDKELTSQELTVLCKKGDVDVIIYAKSMREKIAQILKVYPNILCIAMDEKDEYANFCLTELIANGFSLMKNGSQDYQEAVIDPNTLSVLLFTSGTSDEAKGVMISHTNICTAMQAAHGQIPFAHTDVFLSFLPINHIYESVLGIMLPISLGATVYFSRGMRYLLADFKIAAPTVFLSVPLLIETVHKQLCAKMNASQIGWIKLKTGIALHKILKRFGVDRSVELFSPIHQLFGGRLRILVCGAAPLNPQVQKLFCDVGVNIACAYGLSETTAATAAEFIDDYRLNSTGKMIPQMELKIDSPDENGIGEIVVKGNNVMLGYYNNKEATAEAIRDGWFFTGDLGYVDKEGWLFITGRLKNVIVLKNGKKLSPEEMESDILQNSYIKECVVAGIQNETHDVVITAYIYPDFELLASEQNIQSTDRAAVQKWIDAQMDAINQKLAIYKRIGKVIISNEEFEKTTTKKIKRRKVIS